MALNDFITGNLTETSKRYDGNDYFSPIIVCLFSHKKEDFTPFETEKNIPISSIL
jgi:hypothetical protein